MLLINTVFKILGKDSKNDWEIMKNQLTNGASLKADL